MKTDNQELEIVSQDVELPTKRADNAVAIWDDYRTHAEKLKTTAETLTVTDVSQVAEMKLARATRLALKELRVTIERKRKELGEHYLRASQKINADAKTLKEIIEPLEARLLEQEEFAEREALRVEEERRVRRGTQLSEFLTGPVAVDLGKLTREEYAALLKDSKDAHEARMARVKKEAEEAADRAKAEAEERERIRLENERLKKEAEEADTARRAAELAAKKEREEAAAKARVEKEKADAEIARIEAAQKAESEKQRIALAQFKAAAKAAADEAEAVAKKEQANRDEAARVEREAAEAMARTEREAREKADAELAAIKAADAKSKAKREAEALAAEMAPEKEKLLELAAAVRRLPIHAMKTEKGIDALAEIESKIEQLAEFIEKIAANLEA